MIKVTYIMGGARNLKLREVRGSQEPGHKRGGNNFLCVAEMSTLFSGYVHGKDVARSGGRAPGQEVRKAKPP